jgi:hypothetical protein
MERAAWQERRLVVLRCYQDYVRALYTYRLDPDAGEVRRRREELARAIERACPEDPTLLSDFRRAFATHHRA